MFLFPNFYNFENIINLNQSEINTPGQWLNGPSLLYCVFVPISSTRFFSKHFLSDLYLVSCFNQTDLENYLIRYQQLWNASVFQQWQQTQSTSIPPLLRLTEIPSLRNSFVSFLFASSSSFFRWSWYDSQSVRKLFYVCYTINFDSLSANEGLINLPIEEGNMRLRHKWTGLLGGNSSK